MCCTSRISFKKRLFPPRGKCAQNSGYGFTLFLLRFRFRDRQNLYVMWNCNVSCNSTNRLFAILPSMFPWRHIPCAVLSSLPCGSAPFMIVAVYLISDGHSIFRSFLNWLHHTPKNRNSRIISMVENSRKNAPFFPIGKHKAHCNFMLKYGRISASGGCL